MATISQKAEPATDDQCVVMRGIGWKGYTTVLRLRGERPSPRMVYLDGDLYLMSPAFPHEHLGGRLGMFVMEIVAGLIIPCIWAGSTTYRRRKKEAGVEPDRSFYLANVARVRGKKEIRLSVDPPPDLVVEAVHTHGVDAALKVYQRLRVPEIWLGDEQGVKILVRQANGRYAEAETSAAFPFLKATEIADWVLRTQTEDDTVWLLDVRRWVREVLAPRHQGGPAGGV